MRRLGKGRKSRNLARMGRHRQASKMTHVRMRGRLGMRK